MTAEQFSEAFEEMRVNNLGKQFDRRELGILASQHGIYFNSDMWASGLGRFFRVAKIGTKLIYNFKPTPTGLIQIQEFLNNFAQYRHNDARKIEHAKTILRSFGIVNIED